METITHRPKPPVVTAVSVALLVFAIALCFMPTSGGEQFFEATHAGAQQQQQQQTSVKAEPGNAPHKSAANETPAPQVGQVAPDFRLPYATQEKIFFKPEEQMSLSSLRGRNVILAFYPADWSGGCTKEVCTLRDTFAELSKLNATVLGISGDYVFSHHEWAKHHNLQFPLLSDHDHRVARLYTSFDDSTGFNRRTIFLLDKEGRIRYSNPAFKAGDPQDYRRLREELQKLN